MARIPSANPDFPANAAPTRSPIYRHGLESRQSFIPMAFQVTSPVSRRTALLPSALVLHINPSSLTTTGNKKVDRIQTLGGYVEQHWPDDHDEFSAQGSTGAFMNIQTGTSSILRQRTIAWERYRSLLDLYYNNGSVHDPVGNIVLQGHIMLMFDRGTYLGYFRTFQVEETVDSPFAFNLSWSFKVEETIVRIPSLTSTNFTGPQFQQRNNVRGTPGAPTTSETIELSNAQLAARII